MMEKMDELDAEEETEEDSMGKEDSHVRASLY